MVCSHCGSNQPDDYEFCGACGSTLEKPQQPAPVHRPPSLISKKKYLATAATPAAKRNLRIVTILCIVCAVLLVASVVRAISVSMLDVPLLYSAMKADGKNPEAMLEVMKEEHELAEDIVNRTKATMASGRREAFERTLESEKKLVNHYSVLNYMNYMNVIDEVGEYYFDNVTMWSVRYSLVGMPMLIAMFAAAFILPMLFTLAGGLMRQKGLIAVALVLAVICQFALCSWVWVLVSLVLYIAQIVLCHKVDREYQSYCARRLLL